MRLKRHCVYYNYIINAELQVKNSIFSTNFIYTLD
nr:MAG TPA: hypothetical protein [Caudoviricetes sp.]